MRDGRLTRVLIPHRILGNIYVQELGLAYRRLGCEIVFGPENLFESTFEPDLVHLNWPEDLYRGFGAGEPNRRASRLFRILDGMKERGGRIAWTVHNEKPHGSADGGQDSEIYQKIIDRSDVIHHHCECSGGKLAARYEIPATAQQFVAPHGHYFGYQNEITCDEARHRLGIPGTSFVYLHFGSIRGYKGIDQVLDAFRRVRQRGDLLLAAGRMSGSGELRERLKFARYRYLDRTLRFHLGTVDSDDIQLFLNAADALVLGHTDGLNSGVAVLGMSFGKPVIGPRLGCIPSVLVQGLNFTYETANVDDLVEQMGAVRTVSLEECARRNKDAAASWKWEDIAGPVLERLQLGPRGS